MAEQKFEKALQLGLLDRLLDYEPDTRSEPVITRAESLRRFRASVKRDLEALLNTVRISFEIPESCPELRKSLLNYGLPDVSSMSLQSPTDERRLLRGLEQAIETFEPRLSRARVTSSETMTSSMQAVRFHVEALLLIDPAPERIAFDTVLEISKGAYSIKEG
jgi:type VI secretion system protein ImpF